MITNDINQPQQRENLSLLMQSDSGAGFVNLQKHAVNKCMKQITKTTGLVAGKDVYRFVLKVDVDAVFRAA